MKTFEIKSFHKRIKILIVFLFFIAIQVTVHAQDGHGISDTKDALDGSEFLDSCNFIEGNPKSGSNYGDVRSISTITIENELMTSVVSITMMTVI